jgi:hypothetical protein
LSITRSQGKLPTRRDRAGAQSSLGPIITQQQGQPARPQHAHRSGEKDIHGHERHRLTGERDARAAARQAAAHELELTQQGSLRKLMDTYVDYLAAQGKPGAADARTFFKHVPAEISQRRASALVSTDFKGAIAALVDAGKGTTARQLRAYLRASYGLALAAATDPALPAALHAFGVTHNPVADVSTRTLRKFNRARTRFLDAHELGAFLARVDAMPVGATQDALLLLLYLGGQSCSALSTPPLT